MNRLTRIAAADHALVGQEWWRGAAIYQITNWTIQGYVAGAARHRERERPVGDMPYDEPVDHRAGDEIDQ